MNCEIKHKKSKTKKTKRRKYTLLGWCLLIVLLFSCKKEPDYLERALQFAGENRPELEKVLMHYASDPNDNLKYQAARFLIENMPYCYGIESEGVDSIKSKIAEGLALKIPVTTLINNEAVCKFNRSDRKIVYDAHVITADYLIRNIESAFAAVEKQPWGKYIRFDDFCEYVLPYRVGNEPLSDWREIYGEKYQAVLDSLLTGTDIIDACKAINAVNRENLWEFTHWKSFPDFPHLGPLFLLNNRVGNCVEMLHFTLYSMRSVGIPVGTDYLKLVPGFSTPHFWNFVMDTTGIACDFDNFHGDPERGMFATFWEKKGKVYRKTVAPQQNELFFSANSVDDIPVSLRNVFEKDVSEEYFPLNKITIQCTYQLKNAKRVYLCLFNNKEWIPVGWAKIKNGKAEFPHIDDREIAYLVAYYQNGKLIPACDPFIMGNKYRCYRLKADTTRTQTMNLYRKYPDNRSAFYHEIMIGGKFQAANKKDFSDTCTFSEITEYPQGFAYAPAPENLPYYRYVRYLARKEIRADIAEMEVYGEDSIRPLTGIPIGCPAFNYSKEMDIDKAFDGDPLTYYMSEYNENAWIGLDLGEKKKITKIRYIPRSDDNGIRLNDQYELLYWLPSGWVSAGKQTAGHYMLEYNNIPSNTLYWLRNHTRGVEERIFTYENGKQVWW